MDISSYFVNKCRNVIECCRLPLCDNAVLDCQLEVRESGDPAGLKQRLDQVRRAARKQDELLAAYEQSHQDCTVQLAFYSKFNQIKLKSNLLNCNQIKLKSNYLLGGNLIKST